ncbi:NADH dehydrogenase (ubiquinone) 1 alpha subcomplex 5 [Cryptococcus wingfieldii CBS 7118]|uniref:NADH dehydrogenase (Ubiquinone) 1 alpha subcomplex 5 n=1 Tax=Cryptococcus wingfieldii CBS 7118 TaxID=1295528 RepID=A0A1E3IQN4_9TREE|nr:NADH dehydrogenase (ubiquinone) 1 alpha subcomplex 5 [Cryptococcus wingfieldii CBS 7118]ODN90246.1 NADH dehydrogenase (ubiquinone) 1 alpha subcomplex 5 [Cryptococcus wingfieldii CBS 7118]
MFRATRVPCSALRPLKTSTNIFGLPVHQNPLPALTTIYTTTLASLTHLPSTSVYRQATEAITKHRMSIVEQAQGNVEEAEEKLGGRVVEWVIEEAEREAALAAKAVEWKVWEPLVEEPAPQQWRYFEPLSDDA